MVLSSNFLPDPGLSGKSMEESKENNSDLVMGDDDCGEWSDHRFKRALTGITPAGPFQFQAPTPALPAVVSGVEPVVPAEPGPVELATFGGCVF